MSVEEASTAIENCAVDSDEFTIPSAEELESYYLMLESGTIPELQWKFPGRLNPENTEPTNKTEPIITTSTVESEPAAKNDFDFSDDVAQPQMRVRNQNSTPKSTKKKIANFAGVMEVLKKKNAEGAAS